MCIVVCVHVLLCVHVYNVVTALCECVCVCVHIVLCVHMWTVYEYSVFCKLTEAGFKDCAKLHHAKLKTVQTIKCR